MSLNDQHHLDKKEILTKVLEVTKRTLRLPEDAIFGPGEVLTYDHPVYKKQAETIRKELVEMTLRIAGVTQSETELFNGSFIPDLVDGALKPGTYPTTIRGIGNAYRQNGRVDRAVLEESKTRWKSEPLTPGRLAEMVEREVQKLLNEKS